MRISVIVPTYNRPRELRLCLLSLARQSRIPDEVLVADDGSGEPTRQAVAEFAGLPHCPFPVRHVWQEDEGFRKPRILNETVRRASGDYLIFIDGDCLAHPRFVGAHVDRSVPETVLTGRRVELGESITARILERSELPSGPSVRLFWDSVFGGTRRAEEAVRIETPWLRRAFGREKASDDLWGCNFSLEKDLFYAVNGCDEEFLDGSVEDTDIGIRVVNRGGRIASVRGLAVVFHLWHPGTWTRGSEKYLHNKRILERRIALGESRCRNGIVRDEPA